MQMVFKLLSPGTSTHSGRRVEAPISPRGPGGNAATLAYRTSCKGG